MTLQQHVFITEYLHHRSLFTAYCLAYNVEDQSKYESIMSAAHKLMDDPEIGGIIRSVLDGIRYDVEQEIRAELKTECLTVQRKREILAKIATGEMYAVQVYKGKDCNQCTQHVWPTINQMLKAIDLDNKMSGQYSVSGRHHAGPSGQFTAQTNDLSPSFGQQITTIDASPAPLPASGMEKTDNEVTPLPANTTETIYPDTVTQQNTTTEASIPLQSVNTIQPAEDERDTHYKTHFTNNVYRPFGTTNRNNAMT